MSETPDQHAATLRARYAQIRDANPKARIRTIAQQMQVSEAGLVAAQCGGLQSVRLASPPQAVFKELGTLGRVMALTRNEWCVHERHGKYEDIRAGKTMGIVLGPDIDLRMFFTQWGEAWAVDDGGRRSIQFFDKAGVAIHKVYVTDETDAAAYDALVLRHADPDPQRSIVTPAASGEVAEGLNGFEREDAAAPGQDDQGEDDHGGDDHGDDDHGDDDQVEGDQVEGDQVEGDQGEHGESDPDGGVGARLRADWLAMQDTHEFHGLLRRHQVSRLAALRAAGQDLAQQVSNDLAERMLNDVVAREISFMCFTGNHGMVQIHSGPIKKLMRTGPWFNVLEPHFNLHLHTTAINSTWVVNRPTSDGWVTSLECYAASGELIVQFFGARKPGVPELTAWRKLLCSYCPQPLAA